MSAPAFLCPACSAGHLYGDCICCGQPFAGTPASLCDSCARGWRRCVKCGADATGPASAGACLCGSCGVSSGDCLRCGRA